MMSVYFLACITAIVLLAGSNQTVNPVHAPLRPTVVASYSLRLGEAPDAVVVSNDGHIWVASNAAGAFIQMDTLTGAQSTYRYDKGGAIVTDAVAGNDGSLWYLDGLNTEDIWRVGRDGRFSGISLGDPGHVMAGALASRNGASAIATEPAQNQLLPFDDRGTGAPIAVPREDGSPWSIARSTDGTIWWSRYRGIDWRTSVGRFGSAEVPDVSYLAACGTSAATLAWMHDAGHHRDDYRLSWIDTGGHVAEVRRWPAPPPTPTPRPTLLKVGVTTCGMCGGIAHMPPRRSIGLVYCTPSTAWVQIGDSLTWLEASGKIRSFDLGQLIAGADDEAAADFPDAPRVWLYSVKSQGLVELELR